jgi:RNA polymerase sigma-70 factor (ECF subfamily)
MEALTDPDGTLVARALAGSSEDARDLVRRHEREAWTFLLRVMGRRDAVEDAFQDTWRRAWENLRSWRGRGPFRVWLYAIARRVAADTARPRTASAIPDLEPAAWDRDALADRERAREVRGALALLSPRQREAIVLRYMEDLPFRDVAVVMSVSEATARKYANEGVHLTAERLRANKGATS